VTQIRKTCEPSRDGQRLRSIDLHTSQAKESRQPIRGRIERRTTSTSEAIRSPETGRRYRGSRPGEHSNAVEISTRRISTASEIKAGLEISPL
jgi:hypothetical protein